MVDRTKRRRVAESPDKRRRIASPDDDDQERSRTVPHSDGYRPRHRQYTDGSPPSRRRRRRQPESDLISTAPPVSGKQQLWRSKHSRPRRRDYYSGSSDRERDRWTGSRYDRDAYDFDRQGPHDRGPYGSYDRGNNYDQLDRDYHHHRNDEGDYRHHYQHRRRPRSRSRQQHHQQGDEWWLHVQRRRPKRPRKQYSASFTRSTKPAKPGVAPPQELDKDKAYPHIEWKRDMMLTSSLQVVGEIAEGTFGRVLECIDLDTGDHVAVKVVRASEDYCEAALLEAEILQTLNRMDPDNASGVVRLHGTFIYDSRVCLVMEKLGKDLYEFSTLHNCVGFCLPDIRSMARDLVKTLAFLKKAGLTHTDLKLENMVLVDDEVVHGVPAALGVDAEPVYSARPRNPHVKIIDFGGAVWNSENQNFLVNTRQYRAPEVILDLGWTEACDIWCLGCSLAELYTGQLVFQTHGHLEHLAMIEKIIGPIPTKMITGAGEKAEDLVDRRRGRIAYPDAKTSQASIRNVSKLVPLETTLEGAPSSFVDFVSRMLTIDPALRATPQELLSHPFLLPKNSP